MWGKFPPIHYTWAEHEETFQGQFCVLKKLSHKTLALFSWPILTALRILLTQLCSWAILRHKHWSGKMFLNIIHSVPSQWMLSLEAVIHESSSQDVHSGNLDCVVVCLSCLLSKSQTLATHWSGDYQFLNHLPRKEHNSWLSIVKWSSLKACK